MITAVLFDLDNTIANTDSLKVIRETGMYDLLTEKKLSNISIYPECLELLNVLVEKKIKLGVVTNSGRRYAEKILAHLNLDIFETVVTYTDVKAEGMKPSPEGINLALRALKLKAGDDIFYVGDDYIDIVAAYRAGVQPIVPGWGNGKPISQMPAAVMTAKHLIDELDTPEEIKLIAEKCAELSTFNFMKKRLYFAPLDLSSNVVTLRDDLKVLCFGRYFSQKSLITSRLHDAHKLSLDIFKKELDPNFTAPEYWVELFAHCVEKIPEYIFKKKKHFDIITVIPAKQEKFKRLEEMLGRVEAATSCESEFIDDILWFIEGANSLKTLPLEGRSAEISETLQINQERLDDIRGKTILVIDDVMTTGATFARAYELLMSHGASQVIGVTLAKTVSITDTQKECPACGRTMRINKNKATNIRFWGCTGYNDEINKCKHSEPIEVKKCPKCARSMHRKMNKRKNKPFLSCEGWNMDPKCSYSENIN
ncbi:HAD-IA family hydrolase [Pseudomonas sp. G34]|uniref:HAD-IA family hydrolase n=1 Tax=Pseudomonas sp. G34 TaxID=3059083 RepID=UPI002808314B|nr:HAD-IA family hydrolase [Pseudomonas sp. G34]MDQ7984064.1 HAD-IA family hydrolase [Pseudomonas sp. G34]